MKILKLSMLICIISLHTVLAQKSIEKDSAQMVKSFYSELPEIHVIPIKETMAGRQYELYIKLPDNYSGNNDKKYPVIYFTDAVWHMEILATSTSFLIEDVILVGISWQKDIGEDKKKELGAHASRFRDYNINKSSNAEEQAKYQFGGASNHLAFIHNDVIPYVEKNYRTDSGKRSYFGYSIGGLFGAYILMKQPDTFKNYILGSPGVEGEISILSKLGSKYKNLNANVFITFGSLEDRLGKYALELVGVLKKRKDQSLSVKLEMIEGNHGTAFPMTGVRSVTWLSKLLKK